MTSPGSKTCILRFDVDTDLCLREGVEPLCAVAEKYGVPLTFFVNPGRAIDRRLLLREVLSVGTRGERAPAFGSMAKLGLGETMRLLLVNPRTLPAQAAMLHRIVDGAHEVGLHGGHNHASWQRGARQWSRDGVAAEVAWGKARLEQAAGCAVTAFASPGWTSPGSLPDVLASQGFDVIADARDAHRAPERWQTPSGPIASVPNTLAGEPGGIGYLETRKAAGLRDEAVLAEWDKILACQPSYLCLYDHPFYAGRHALALFEGLIERVLSQGYHVMTVTQAGRRVLGKSDPVRQL